MQRRIKNQPIRKLSQVLLILPMLLVGSCASNDEPATAREPRPGFLSRTLDVFRGSPDRIEKAGQSNYRDIVLTVATVPEQIDLDRVRRLAVEIVLRNDGKEFVNLQFPTAQRLDILLRDDDGSVLTRWSEDRAFTQEVGHVSINPGERVVYKETISMRELKPGQTYLLEVMLIGYPELYFAKSLVPNG